MPTNKLTTFSVISLLVIFLALIRAFETHIFYDPFLVFFKEDFKNAPLPKFDSWKLVLNILLRYLLNTMLSLAIIFVVFKKKALVQFTAILYLFFFVILFSGFYFLLSSKTTVNVWLLFYVRRFLIQPIFVLLFVPALYYQEQKEKNNI
ncbi:exosortase F system-associated membrane protein [Flavobacterium agrisoli]|uniref:Exosortase F system-associated protein n=1 Tax=Flavobacterium agrisoli TaxID=2793066 RepID=A0A934PP88_9FLAO|nr:exosortase F system-associated protein [Flavobacterium agrisoli]MBK0370399.1 exosortase F system-associated protein [Flavobacterium agrisoli]